MRVRFSKLALAELDAILANIRDDNPLAAARFEAHLQLVLARIAQFPQSAPEVAQRQGIRRVPLVRYPYMVHYTQVGDEVMILRILHGARRSPWG